MLKPPARKTRRRCGISRGAAGGPHSPMGASTRKQPEIRAVLSGFEPRHAGARRALHAGMTITEHTLIADIASGVPSSVRVFQRHGVDFCCGGKRPLGTACAELGLSVAEVAREIEASAAKPDASGHDWATASLDELTRHIVATYHDVLREELPRVEALAARVARVHGEKAPGLFDHIESAVRELSADLMAHMRKEEGVLFPAIGALERSGTCAVPLAQAIRVMESEHDRAGELLADLRSTTGSFSPPDWACATTRALYQGLAAIESEMHVHVHLENNVLFPRVLRLAGRAPGSWCSRS
jgi:regulator of cell morphogenesis and NO signaling